MKTFVGNLFAVSTLTAFIATSIPSASAIGLSPAPHVARHLLHAHGVKAKRNLHKKSCGFHIPAPDPAKIVSSNTNTGGSTQNNGGSTQNNGGGTQNNGGGTQNNGGGTQNNGGGGYNNGGSGGSGGNSGGGGGGGSGSSGLSGKKGLAFPMGCADLQKWHPWSDIKWHYNWRPTPYGDCPPGLPPFIPMLWGFQYEQDFEDAMRGQNPHTVLFLNEPDMGGYLSSGVSPQDAVGLWNRHIQPLKDRGVRIGSAATTSAPYGKQWMQEFEAACSNCRADFMAIHYYDVTPQGFIDYATDWHNTFGRPIWVTEMACQSFNDHPQCNMDQIYDFVRVISHFCETTDWIEAYTFFGAMSDVQNVNYLDKMTESDGVTPNALGYFMLSSY